ncbi:MAG TPA: prolyl oligopeptidase family serine peptidase [Ignavibacteriaceae bacterium]|nr:prolyl oligopeptidase family serine peptidase [Ignavibacteriaceae bacterium]
MANMIDREEIKLTESHVRMVDSGWGKEVTQHSIVEKITYLSDGLKVKGYLAYPHRILKGNKIPLIIWNRGGYKENGVIDSFTARGMFGQIASWGYAVLASQYRGNDGGEGEEELGGKDVNDIKNLFPVAEELQFIDTNTAGVEGWSRGGMMTFILLKEMHNFKCAVLSGAISNLKSITGSEKDVNRNYEKIVGNDFEKKIKERSAINFTNSLPDIPYLLMHGSADNTVPVEQTIELAKKFSAEGKNYRLVIFEEGDHYLKNHRKEVDRLRKYWFDRYLKT